MGRFETKRLPSAVDAIAPDGSEVRVLCSGMRGSMAHFSLPLGQVSQAVAHHRIEGGLVFPGRAGPVLAQAGGGRRNHQGI